MQFVEVNAMTAYRWLTVSVLAGSTIAALGGCGAPDRLVQPHDDELAAAVAKLGFRTDGMIVEGDQVVVEGDIVLSRRAILEADRRGPASRRLDFVPDGPRPQWNTTALVSLQNVANVSVDLSGISSSSAWVTAVRQAMAHWNTVPGTTVNFHEATPGDIAVQFKYLGDSRYIAQSQFPIAGTGEPGANLYINSVGISLTPGQQSFTITHELGHSIGFRHTGLQYWCNGSYVDETVSDTVGAHLIAGTPTSDGASVMNACSASNSWAGFSHYDSVAVMNLYGGASLSEANVGGYPVVSYSFPPRGLLSGSVGRVDYYTEANDWYQQVTTVNGGEGTNLSSSPSQYQSSAVWGYSSCSTNSNFPYPEDDSYWELTAVYPQGQIHLSVPAHVQSPSDYTWQYWDDCL